MRIDLNASSCRPEVSVNRLTVQTLCSDGRCWLREAQRRGLSRAGVAYLELSSPLEGVRDAGDLFSETLGACIDLCSAGEAEIASVCERSGDVKFGLTGVDVRVI